MNKNISEVKPMIFFQEYLKYGLFRTKVMLTKCPCCESTLNAGPSYQPEFCSDCGKKLDWSDIKWVPEESLPSSTTEIRSRDDSWLKEFVGFSI